MNIDIRNDITLNTIGKTLLATACLAIAGVGAAHAQTQLNFTNLAGGWTGDGGQAKAAYLLAPNDVVFDATGNMYVSQPWANRIRKITPGGVITTVVGGNTGFAGDGGLASKALIDRPGGMAFDAAGNLYFSDYGNARVRRIAPNGTITTFAGNGNLAASGDNGQAKSAGIGGPTGLAIDKNGNLFFADSYNDVVRKVTSAGVISTYAGNGTAGNSGNDGPAKSAQLNSPEGVAVDASGNVYIADMMNSAVRRVSTSGTISAFMSASYPLNVEVDKSGNVYATSDCTIIKRTPTGTFVTYGSTSVLYCEGKTPDGTLSSQAGFGYTDGIAIDAAGNIFFVDSDFSRIVKISVVDNKAYTHAGAPPVIPNGTLAANAMTTNAGAVSVADDGAVMFYEWLYNYRVRKLSGGRVWNYAGNGSYVSGDGCEAGIATSCGFGRVSGLASAPGGVTYIADRNMNMVFRVEPNGALTAVAGGGSMTAENVPATNVRLYIRGNIALDEAGNLYIADNTNNRIRKVNKAGMISTFAGADDVYAPNLGDNGPAIKASVSYPVHVAVDGAGNVFEYESVGVVRKIGLDGIIRRVTGKIFQEAPNQTGGYSGEGGLAINAFPGVVTAMAAHPSGLYFVSEGKVRRVRPDGKIETVKGVPNRVGGMTTKFGYLYTTGQDGRIQRAQLPKIPVNDFNGDRRSDIFWRATTGVDQIWLSADSATKQTAATLASENKLVAQGDFDGDGKSDLVFRNTINGNTIVWRAGNANTQMVFTAMPDQAWTIVGAGDFNGDGKSDLFWRNTTTGSNQVWLTGNSATKLAVTGLVGWVVAGLGDFDADGKTDILWRNPTTGSNTIWSAGNAASRKFISGVTNLAWKVAAIGDFNGDGVSDVLWRDTVKGTNAIWKSGVNTWPMPVTGLADQRMKVAAVGDYDNDGIDDILWRNTGTGANVIWTNSLSTSTRAVTSQTTSWSAQPVAAQP